MDHHSREVDEHLLKHRQLLLLKALFQERTLLTFYCNRVATYNPLDKLVILLFFSEVVKLIFIFAAPATNATNEGSFSALRLIKTLWSTMTVTFKSSFDIACDKLSLDIACTQ